MPHVSMTRVSIFVLLASFCFNAFAAEQVPSVEDRDWTKIKDKNGIQVYRAHTENSKFKSFQAVTRMELDNIQSFVGLLMDGENYPKWLHMLTSCEINTTSTPGKYDLQMETHMPWPVKNRFVRVNNQMSQGEDFSIRFDIGEPEIPATPRKGFIIIPETYGYYELKTVPNSKDVIITVEIFADPGGYIPPFLINIITGDFSYYTTRKMRKFIKNEQYQNYEHPLIKRRPWIVANGG